MNTNSKSDRRIVAIGDVHGCALELEALLRKVQIQKDDLVVFLGDYIDRGPDSRRVVDIVLDLRRRCEVVALRGNHEAMLLDFLDHPESTGSGLFVLNGGASTLVGYAEPDGSIVFSEEHLQFFRELKYFHQTEKYFFVHAGVPNQPLSSLNIEEHGHHLLWSRYPFLSSNYKWEKLVIHGHTPVEEVEVRPNRVNLDTGCVYDRKLTAMELPTGLLFQVEKGIKKEPRLYPKEFIESSRLTQRFSGRMAVRAQRPGEAERTFETLNYNQFGFLMQEVPKHTEPAFESGDRLSGKIGEDPRNAVEFSGQVVRYEARGGVILYGVKIDSLSEDPGQSSERKIKFERSG